MRIKFCKCLSAQKSIKLLGHIAGEEIMNFAPESIKTINLSARPTSRTEAQIFLGLDS